LRILQTHVGTPCLKHCNKGEFNRIIKGIWHIPNVSLTFLKLEKLYVKIKSILYKYLLKKELVINYMVYPSKSELNE
jgi:hypothetical protein